jgi:hypothetical protein
MAAMRQPDCSGQGAQRPDSSRVDTRHSRLLTCECSRWQILRHVISPQRFAMFVESPSFGKPRWMLKNIENEGLT